MKLLYVSYGLGAVLWLASLVACFLAILWSIRPTPGSIRRAMVLSIFALAVGFMGGNVFHLSYSRHVSTTRSREGKPDVVSVTDWSVDSKRFFQFSGYLGAFALILAVIRRARVDEPARLA